MEFSGASSALLGIAVVLALVLANAFFVAAEFALVGARRTRLDELVNEGDGKAVLARRALDSLDRYISATQLGITLASLGLGWVGEPALAHLLESAFEWLPPPVDAIATHGVAVATAFLVITVLHIVLGELMPKAVALLFPETVSRWVAVPLIGFAWVVAIPVKVLNGAANWMLRKMGVRAPSEHQRLHSPEEIRMLVEQSEEGGALRPRDARLLEAVFDFGHKRVDEVMTARPLIRALQADDSIEVAAAVIADVGRSRYPVHEGSIDEIVGLVYAKDVLRALREDPAAKVSSVMTSPWFVPGMRGVGDVLGDMKRRKTHMALVVDEYGGIAGLVTLEDLLEEIVGPIFDEHDVEETAATSDASGTLLDASLSIEEFNQRFDEALEDPYYNTLGGHVLGRVGRLPREGDRVVVGRHTVEVVRMEGRRVASVRVARSAAPGAPRA